jgi:choline dehydrogenase-like flavoprotein
MLIDSSQLSSTDHQVELCIIGSGPAALTLVQTLGVDRNLLLLEAGPESSSEPSQALYRGSNIGLPYFDLDGCRSRQFGGSANCWGGFCRLFDDHDFELRPNIPHSGWPFQREHMQPFFEQAHRICQLGPLDYSYANWASESGQGPSPFTGPYVTPEIRQKANFDLSSARAALASSPGSHVYLNANVTELVTTGDGKAVTRVEFRDAGGRLHRLRPGVIVLAAGGIENPRLLLASRSVQQDGIGNDDGLVGRFFMEHIDIDAGSFRPTSPEMFRSSWCGSGPAPSRCATAWPLPSQCGARNSCCGAFSHR